MTITDNLTQVRDQWKRLGAGAWLFYDFILCFGQSYQGQPLPRRYRKRAPKACFFNARALVLRSGSLRYCEGYALDGKLPFPFEHAWALDQNDRVIDPTLAHPESYQFYGLILDRAWLRPTKRRYSGVLRDEIGMYRTEVLQVLAPDWMREVYEPVLAELAQKACLHHDRDQNR